MIISLDTRTVIQNERILVKYEPATNNNDLSSTILMSDERKNFYYVINGTWRLIIRHLKESDRGCYMCQVNTSPMISQTGCLDILGKVFFLLSSHLSRISVSGLLCLCIDCVKSVLLQ